MKTKIELRNRILELEAELERSNKMERRVLELEASRNYTYHSAGLHLTKLNSSNYLGSGFVLQITNLGDKKEIFSPVMILDGFTDETINALLGEFIRSHEVSNIYKPRATTYETKK